MIDFFSYYMELFVPSSPLLRLKRGEYVTSFKALEDAPNEGIDCLIRDLEGVMYVSAVVRSLLENIVDAEDDETLIDGRDEDKEDE